MNDKVRFETILKLLPETKAERIYNEVNKGQLPRALKRTINNYLIYTDKVESEFSGNKINETFIKLNGACTTLYKFLMVDFFPDNFRATMLVLQPEWKYSDKYKEYTIKLKKLQKLATAFFKLYREFLRTTFKQLNKNVELVIPRYSSFDIASGIIKLDEQEVQLPPFKNEYCLAKYMFDSKAKNPIDWSFIYEEMTGNPVSSNHKNKRTVYDASESINSRLKKIGYKPIFDWKEKTILRLY